MFVLPEGWEFLQPSQPHFKAILDQCPRLVVLELYDDFVTKKELKKYNSKSRSRKIREVYIIEQAPTVGLIQHKDTVAMLVSLLEIMATFLLG
jgi:hypothetical protein